LGRLEHDVIDATDKPPRRKGESKKPPKKNGNGPKKQPESEEEKLRKELEKKYSAEIEKARPFLQEGWYVVKDGDNLAVREKRPGGSKTRIGTYDEALEKYLIGLETSEIKEWRKTREGQQARQGGEGGLEVLAKSTTLIPWIVARAKEELPIVRNMLSKMSWIQNSLYDLGVLTFYKITQTPGLLPQDTWKITLSDTKDKDEIQEAREDFAEAYQRAFDKLIAGLGGAQALAELETELNLESGRLLRERQFKRKAELDRDYYHMAFNTAISSMCAVDQKDLIQRLVVQGLVRAPVAAAETIDAQVAQEETKSS